VSVTAAAWLDFERWIRPDLPRFTHVNGIWFFDAPLPPRLHRCRAWTTDEVTGAQRCACGALAFRDGPGSEGWADVNSRRNDRITEASRLA